MPEHQVVFPCVRPQSPSLVSILDDDVPSVRARLSARSQEIRQAAVQDRVRGNASYLLYQTQYPGPGPIVGGSNHLQGPVG
jgi:hypothetical protein